MWKVALVLVLGTVAVGGAAWAFLGDDEANLDSLPFELSPDTESKLPRQNLETDNLPGLRAWVLARATELGIKDTDGAGAALAKIAGKLPGPQLYGIRFGTLGDDEFPDIVQGLKTRGTTWGELKAQADAKLAELGVI